MAATATPPSTTSSAIFASRCSAASRRSRRSSSSATSPSACSGCRSPISHPAVYLVLILPFGLVSGYVSVTLGYLLGHGGVKAEQVAVLCAAGLLALGMIPPVAAWLPWLSAVALGASLAITLLAMSVESLMAYGTPDGQRGRAG